MLAGPRDFHATVQAARQTGYKPVATIAEAQL
jgi:hypothetical protein